MLKDCPLKTGQVLRLELGNGIVDSWEIEGFHYGNVGQESVIQIRKLGTRLATVSTRPEPYDKVQTFVPANLIHAAIESGLLAIYESQKER